VCTLSPAKKLIPTKRKVREGEKGGKGTAYVCGKTVMYGNNLTTTYKCLGGGSPYFSDSCHWSSFLSSIAVSETLAAGDFSNVTKKGWSSREFAIFVASQSS